LASFDPSDQAGLQRELELWLLQLALPGKALSEESAYVLQELSEQPFAAAVIDRLGAVRAKAPAQAVWEVASERVPVQLVGRASASILTPEASEHYRRLYAAPFDPDDGQTWLVLELRVDKPWRRALRNASFEWPVILVCLILIGGCAALFLGISVTRRLRSIGQAARSWAHGDFARKIADRSGDEIGTLSQILDQMADRLRELVRSRSAFARVAERDRMARDLHDTVKQKAFALHMKLAALKARAGELPSVVADDLETARKLVHAMQQELASIMQELTAQEEHLLPLGEQLRAQLENWGQLSGVQVSFSGIDEWQIASEYRSELQRLLDEALANVMKHSGASLVEVRLQRDGGRARLTIDDNGRGSDLSHESGMGLGNMRRRAELLPDGHFQIESAIARGTRIVVSWDALQQE
jgi:signal transduction histidine kinase